MLVIPELEREVELLWELRDTRKVFIDLIIIFYSSGFIGVKFLKKIIIIE